MKRSQPCDLTPCFGYQWQLNGKVYFFRFTVAIICLFWISTLGLAQLPPGTDAGTLREPPRKFKGTSRQVISKKVNPTPTTGNLSVAADSNANLLVEPVNGGTALKGTVGAHEDGFFFSGLKPGQRYRVAGSLKGYEDEEAYITIEANTTKVVKLDFKPTLYVVNVTTNIENGTLKYSSQNEPQVSVVDIRNKKAQLRVQAGSYNIELESEDFGYEPLRQSVVVNGATTLNFDVKRVALSEGTYAPQWTSAEVNEWEMPQTWQPSGNLLTVKGAGVGLPKATGLRFYKDVQIVTTVRMNKPVAVSFALRAQNTKNYYLLQITGEKSDEPYTLRLFVVKDGVARRVQAVPYASSTVSGMSAREYFEVSAKMVGFVITVQVEDKTGRSSDLGALTDPNQTYPVGAVGIAAREDEDNVVERFIICARSCGSN